MSNVRTRFAPSPTGLLHLGAARTALYSWLLAKQHRGQFILRIEDTDRQRHQEAAIENIKQSLSWLGLDWDEYYQQSQRLEIYRQQAIILYKHGLAYTDPRTPAELEGLRQQAKAAKQPFLIRHFRPDQPKEWDGQSPLRFKTPIKSYQWQDVVRGKLSAGEEAVDDFILLKSDGWPTYNFAHVVDDHLMQVSHVLRGDEFIASTPKFLALYKALSWQPPQFVTLPPILGVSGGKKLSKREGATSLLEYKERGYLATGVINFLALLGWNDGSEQEVFALDALIKKFDLKRIHKSAARFNSERLDWLNGQHLRGLDLNELKLQAEPFWPAAAKDGEPLLKQRVLEVLQDRLKYLGELTELSGYFFEENLEYIRQQASHLDTDFKQKLPDYSLKTWLSEVDKMIQNLGSDKEQLGAALRQRVKAIGQPATLWIPLRVILAQGHTTTPPIWELVYALGKDTAQRRLAAALEIL